MPQSDDLRPRDSLRAHSRPHRAHRIHLVLFKFFQQKETFLQVFLAFSEFLHTAQAGFRIKGLGLVCRYKGLGFRV